MKSAGHSLKLLPVARAPSGGPACCPAQLARVTRTPGAALPSPPAPWPLSLSWTRGCGGHLPSPSSSALPLPPLLGVPPQALRRCSCGRRMLFWPPRAHDPPVGGTCRTRMLQAPASRSDHWRLKVGPLALEPLGLWWRLVPGPSFLEPEGELHSPAGSQRRVATGPRAVAHPAASCQSFSQACSV